VDGIVKWFDPVKGFGFITRADGLGDVFFNIKDLEMEGYKEVRADQRVRFVVQVAKRGPVGKSITLIES